jgi:hypothetical protein
MSQRSSVAWAGILPYPTPPGTTTETTQTTQMIEMIRMTETTEREEARR